MKEIELRLALVFYGGVSLAIYMHGVSRDVLNLVRASSYRLDRKSNGTVPEGADQPLPPVQNAFKDLLDLLCPVADIRVVVNAIAGASAGGVNGIMLARAIAHDLPLDSHSHMWLKNADVTRLSRPQAGLSRYLKMSISPVLDQPYFLAPQQTHREPRNPGETASLHAGTLVHAAFLRRTFHRLDAGRLPEDGD